MDHRGTGVPPVVRTMGGTHATQAIACEQATPDKIVAANALFGPSPSSVPPAQKMEKAQRQRRDYQKTVVSG